MFNATYVKKKCRIGHAKTVKLIELPFGIVGGLAHGIVYYMGVNSGAAWKIRFNCCVEKLISSR